MTTVTTPLGLRADTSVDGDTLERLEKLETYDLAFIRDRLLAKDLVAEPLVDEAIDEFRRYVGLIIMGQRSLPMYSSEVDEVWHNFILYTRNYADFCDAVVGRFIHHIPTQGQAPSGPAERTRFVSAYQRAYGPLAGIWGTGGDCSGDKSDCKGEGDSDCKGD